MTRFLHRYAVIGALAGLSLAGAQDPILVLLAQMESQNWVERSKALEQIVKVPGALQQPVVRSVLLSRLDTENQIIRQTLRDSHDQRGVSDVYGEDYGEYVDALGDAVEAFVDWEDSATLRILAQQAFNEDSKFAERLARYADRILPVLVEDSKSDSSTIRTTTHKYAAGILHVYKPAALRPEGAAQLMALLNNGAALQERNSNVRSNAASLLAELADVNGDRKVDCADVSIVKAAMGTKRGEIGFDARADINLDGVVDEKDLAYVNRYLPLGTRCDAR